MSAIAWLDLHQKYKSQKSYPLTAPYDANSLKEGELDRIQLSNRIGGYSGRFSCQTIQAQIVEVDSVVSSLGGRMESVKGVSAIASDVLDWLADVEAKQNNQSSAFSTDEHLSEIAQTCKCDS